MVVFDMAGTTVADDGAIALAFQRAMQEWGYFIPVSLINPLMGYKKPEAIRIMLSEYETNEDRITTKLVDRIHDRFLAHMLGHYRYAAIMPLPHVEASFARLRSAGIRVALDTGFSRDIADVILGRLGWLRNGLVDDLVASDEVPKGRPYPYMINRLMERAGITDPLEVVKVGDTEVDIHEGLNAGCLFSIAVTTGAFTADALVPHNPSFIIDDLSQLMPLLEHVTATA